MFIFLVEGEKNVNRSIFFKIIVSNTWNTLFLSSLHAQIKDFCLCLSPCRWWASKTQRVNAIRVSWSSRTKVILFCSCFLTHAAFNTSYCIMISPCFCASRFWQAEQQRSPVSGSIELRFRGRFLILCVVHNRYPQATKHHLPCFRVFPPVDDHFIDYHTVLLTKSASQIMLNFLCLRFPLKFFFFFCRTKIASNIKMIRHILNLCTFLL